MYTVVREADAYKYASIHTYMYYMDTVVYICKMERDAYE